MNCWLTGWTSQTTCSTVLYFGAFNYMKNMIIDARDVHYRKKGFKTQDLINHARSPRNNNAGGKGGYSPNRKKKTRALSNRINRATTARIPSRCFIV